MANSNTPMGAWPVEGLFGPANDIGRTLPFKVKASQTIYVGDFLSADATGTVVASTADDGVIVVGVASHYVVGNASGTTDIAVWPATWYIFGIQSDTGTATTAADVFATANHVAGSGDATTKMSGHELDASDIGTGLQMRLLGLDPTPGNAWGEHSIVRFMFNECILIPNGGATV